MKELFKAMSTFRGAVQYGDRALFEFQDEAGQSFSANIQSVLTDKVHMLDIYDSNVLPVPLYMQNWGNYWFHYLDEELTLYFQYRDCIEMKTKPFKNFAEELLSFVDTHPVDKFIIDLRQNSGGDSRILNPLVAELKMRQSINEKGRLFAIVGRRTFSSAVLNLVTLEEETKAIFVGEPSGNKPNHYGFVREIILPNSKLKVIHSRRYFNNSKRDTDSFYPDHIVDITAEDYFTGNDAILDKILKYPQPKDVRRKH